MSDNNIITDSIEFLKILETSDLSINIDNSLNVDNSFKNIYFNRDIRDKLLLILKKILEYFQSFLITTKSTIPNDSMLENMFTNIKPFFKFLNKYTDIDLETEYNTNVTEFKNTTIANTGRLTTNYKLKDDKVDMLDMTKYNIKTGKNVSKSSIHSRH